jgi:uncharacterized membrane protein YbhN (UPF0104 family)
MQKKRLFYILLSFVVSAVLIWILISQVETSDLVQTFSSIYFPAFLAFMAIALAGVLLRSWRYRWLLKPYPISWKNIILVTFIRNLFVDLFPARIGSLSYIYLLNRRLNFSFEAATSTLVIAVIFDFITLSPFLFISILAVGIASSALPLSALLLASLVFFLVICLILWKISQIFSLLGRGLSFLSRSFRLEGQKWVRISAEKIQLIKDYLVQSKKRKILFPLFSLSLFIRLAKYGSLYFLLYSLLRSHGMSLERISFWKTILGTTGAELTSALPIKGIGGFGTWESAWALTFRLMNFDSRLAILSGIGVHLLTNLFEYSLGIAAILILVFPLLKKGKKIR